MKKNVLLLIISILTVNLYGQNHDIVCIINPADNFHNVSQPDIVNNSQYPQIPDSMPLTNMFTYRRGQNPILYDNHIIIVRFYDRKTKKLIRLGELDEMTIEIFKQSSSKKENQLLKSNSSIVKIERKQEQMGMTDFNIYLESELAEKNVPHLTNLIIEVRVKDDTYGDVETSFKGQYFVSSLSTYNSFGTKTNGFWMPTLLFSSNLKQTNNGIPFASLPIGIAFGVKYNTKKGKYIGLSAMGNWLIYTQPENSTIATANSFNLQGATLGCLLDINDVISIGYAYGFNFKSNQNDPGSMFVLGFGTKILGFLKSGEK